LVVALKPFLSIVILLIIILCGWISLKLMQQAVNKKTIYQHQHIFFKEYEQMKVLAMLIAFIRL
jgi:hypothetical protein